MFFCRFGVGIFVDEVSFFVLGMRWKLLWSLAVFPKY